MAGEPDLVEGATDADTNGYVTYAQQLLTGYYNGAIDGIFGPVTDAAAKQYQGDKGLTVDGWIGPITWGSLTGEGGGGGGQEISLDDFPTIKRIVETVGSESDVDNYLMALNIDPSGITDGDDTAYA